MVHPTQFTRKIHSAIIGSTMKAHVSTEELFEKVTQLELQEFDNFISKVLTLQAKRHTNALTKEESELVKQISLGISSETWQHYEKLKDKRRASNLSSEEHTELVGISNQIEIANAKRFSALVQLSAIRETSLEALMKEFGIQAPSALRVLNLHPI